MAVSPILLLNTAQYCSILLNSFQYCSILFNTAQYGARLFKLAQHCAMLLNTEQYCSIPPKTAKDCSILLKAAQYCSILLNMVQYCTRLLNIDQCRSGVGRGSIGGRSEVDRGSIVGRSSGKTRNRSRRKESGNRSMKSSCASWAPHSSVGLCRHGFCCPRTAPLCYKQNDARFVFSGRRRAPCMVLEVCNSGSTPRTKETADSIANDGPLLKEAETSFQAAAARSNYLSIDRPDCQFASKEICRLMTTPTRRGHASLKRLCRNGVLRVNEGSGTRPGLPRVDARLWSLSTPGAALRLGGRKGNRQETRIG